MESNDACCCGDFKEVKASMTPERLHINNAEAAPAEIFTIVGIVDNGQRKTGYSTRCALWCEKSRKDEGSINQRFAGDNEVRQHHAEMVYKRVTVTWDPSQFNKKEPGCGKASEYY